MFLFKPGLSTLWILRDLNNGHISRLAPGPRTSCAALNARTAYARVSPLASGFALRNGKLLRDSRGAVAQLGARGLCKSEVRGSIPLSSILPFLALSLSYSDGKALQCQKGWNHIH